LFPRCLPRESVGHRCHRLLNAVKVSSAGKQSQCKPVLDCMEEMMAAERVRPPLAWFNLSIHLFGHWGMVDQAWETLRRIVRVGLRPDGYTISSMMSTLERAGRGSEAIALLENMERAGSSPDVASVSVVMRVLVRERRFSEAIRWWERARVVYKLEPTPQLWVAMLDVCAKKGDAEMASQVMTEMTQSGAEPTYQAIVAMVDAMSRAQKFDLASQWYQRLLRCNPPDSVVNHSLSIIVREASRWGSSKECIEILKSRFHSSNSPPTLYLYTPILDALARRGDVAGLQRVLDEGGLLGDVVCNNLLLKACVRAKQFRHGLELLRMMPERGVRPDVYSFATLITGLAKSGFVGQAYPLLAEMIASGLKPNTHIFTSLISAAADAGDTQACKKIFEDMKTQHELVPSLATLSALLKGLSQSEDPTAVTTLWDEIRDSRFLDSRCFQTIMSIFLRRDQFDEAYALLSQMKFRQVPRSIQIYTMLIQGALRLSTREIVGSLLDLMKEDGISPDRRLKFHLLHYYNALPESDWKLERRAMPSESQVQQIATV